MRISPAGNSTAVLRWVTAPPVPFPAAVIVSLVLHGALAFFIALAPSHEPGAPIEVYRVKLVGAPPRPEARRLDVAREAPRAAESAAATPSTAAPLVVPNVPTPNVTVPSTPPAAAAQTAPAAQAPAPTVAAPSLRERARGPAAPQAPLAPTGPQAQQSQAVQPAPRLPPAPPSLQAPATPAEALPGAPPAESQAQTPRPAPQQPQAPPAPSALEALRGIVREQQTAAPQATQTAPAAPVQSNPLSELARRRYRSGIGTRVRENHTYPADFPCGIESVWTITIGRDGGLLASELLQSSGDARYDYAVQLTIRATQFAPLPEEIPGNTLQETLRFTPKRCPAGNP